MVKIEQDTMFVARSLNKLSVFSSFCSFPLLLHIYRYVNCVTNGRLILFANQEWPWKTLCTPQSRLSKYLDLIEVS